jgi:hypothetical protein
MLLRLPGTHFADLHDVRQLQASGQHYDPVSGREYVPMHLCLGI